MNRKMLFGWAVLMLVGCATGREIGAQRIVERIPSSQPDWRSRSSWEERDVLHYVGAVTGRADMALGLREAKAEGEKKLAEQIRQRIRTEFGSAIEGQNVDGQTGSFVKDVIAKVSENVTVSGVRQSENFVEKVEERTGFGVKYVYNAFVLLELGRPDYLQARKDALDGAVAEARRSRNAKAEESLRLAFDKLEAGAQ